MTDILPTESIATSGFAVISGPNIIPASPPATGTITFTPIANLGVGVSGSIEFNVALTAGVGAIVTNQARFSSTQRTTPVTSSVSATVAPINANLQTTKTSSLYDPLNEGKFHLLGEVVIYAIKVRNLGDPVSSNTISIVDPLPSSISFSRLAFDASTTEPVKFIDGAGGAVSGMSCCSVGNLLYSIDSGVTYNYLPPAALFDDTITHIKLQPTASMSSGVSTAREFTILFKARIK